MYIPLSFLKPLLNFYRKQSGATLVEDGGLRFVAIALGGSGLISLSSQTASNINDANLTVQTR